MKLTNLATRRLCCCGTPLLEYAVPYGHRRIVQLLRAHGDDFTKVGNVKKTGVIKIGRG